ncbi:M20 family metallopeptidase [Sutcliffiella cohnii]|uniref:M20 metallopeptidase family protein n=1 Tax=Sutcliffiella cohnii TaxID=33932 RepID=UPI002E1BC545|nr:M20 family metallopeptidase [Sutcliffiella cohnii]
MTKTTLNNEALIKEILAFRRDLHLNPELSGEEFETSKKIQQKLTEHGIPFKTGFAKTGVLGIIKGAKPGKTVALRADIDALPIQEQSGVEYASTVDGKMHACGHDAHTAMLLGAGILLHEQKENLAGTVLLVFQPAEENSPVGGAQRMMDDGVFDEFPPDVVLGQHVWPDLPVGQFGVRPGPIMGNSDRFTIVVKGSGGHASMPHQTNDAIIIANQVITTLQTIVSRNVDPINPAVLTIGKISGGYRYNVIADRVTLEGSIRTTSNETKNVVRERFFKILNGLAEAMNAEIDIEYLDGYPATVNTPEWSNRIKQTATRLYGKESAPDVPPSMGGEDFSRFLQKYPGAYYWLGASIGEGQKPLHDPEFKLDERAIPLGIEFMTEVTIDTLNQLLEKETE